MAGITHDFAGLAVVSPGNASGKEFARILDRECNGYFNDVYLRDNTNTRISLRGVVLGPGGVGGPGTSTDNALARWDGTTGQIVQNSLVILSDLGDLSGIRNLTATGTVILSGNTFPTTAGSSGQVLTTNGSGTLSWTTNGAGDVIGPASATDNALARFDSTTGKLIQNSLGILNDLGDLSGLRGVNNDFSANAGNTLSSTSVAVACTDHDITDTGTGAFWASGGVNSGTTHAGANNIMLALDGTNVIERATTQSFFAACRSVVTNDDGALADGVGRCYAIGSDAPTFDVNAAGVISMSHSGMIGCSSCTVQSTGTNGVLNSMLLASNFVLLPQSSQCVVAGGYAGAGPAASANMKWRIKGVVGDIDVAGAVNTGVVFTDIAEYFENTTNGVIPLGTIVTTVAETVRPAKSGERIAGVVSGTAALIMNDSAFCYSKRYVRDEFGVVPKEGVLDETTNQIVMLDKEAENYDPTREWVRRKDRPAEWSCVGLKGRVYVRVDETVTADCYVKPGAVDGQGTKALTETALWAMRVSTPFDAGKGYGVALCLVGK